MKTREYVNKYNLNKSDDINHFQFVMDLSNDFEQACMRNKAKLSEKRFEQSIREIKDKFKAINNKTRGNIKDKVWDYFYAVVVMKKRQSYRNESGVMSNMINCDYE